MKNITRYPLLLLAFFAAVAGSTACAQVPATCTELAAVSVTVNVEDDLGQPVDDATVTFAVDGGAADDCSFLDTGTYLCGTEVEGDFVITVDKPGLIGEEAAVTVEADECHVIGQTLDIVLDREGA